MDIQITCNFYRSKSANNSSIVDNKVKNFQGKLDKVYNSICRLLDLPEQGTFTRKFLLSGWNPDNIPHDIGKTSESFEEVIIFLRTSIIDGKEIRSYLKKRISH
jgi:hypothetical protein